MTGIADYFSISTEFSDTNEIPFPSNSVLIQALSTTEDRYSLSANFSANHPNVEVGFVEEFENQEINISFTNYNKTISLRSGKDLETVKQYLENKEIFLDITGLTHSAWAWLIKCFMLRNKGQLWALYSEPIEYKFHDSPLDGQYFDLSERITGIEPLPGFATLSRYNSGDFVFLPLLGFEGARLSHIMEDVQPVRQLTFPVIGVPGFHFDFPFYAYQGNRVTLEREGIWKNRRYEKANCPASIFILGKNFISQYPQKTLRIAPIGTKPHALGAILLKLAFPSKVDIVYDHPIRKSGRTRGKAKTLCYQLKPFTEIITSKW